MKRGLCLILVALIWFGCKDKPENEVDVDISEEIGTIELPDEEIPDVMELLKDATQQIEGEYSEEETDILTKEQKYLKKSIEDGNLTIDSEYRDIPGNFEPVGIVKLKKHLGRQDASFIEATLEEYWLGDREARKGAMRRLGLAKGAQIDTVLMRYLEIPMEELELLKVLPGTERIYRESFARMLQKYELPPEITGYLATGKASENFKLRIDQFEKAKLKSSRNFINKSKKARDAFYELNPSWYGDSGESGDTYIDARKQHIYLPFGDLSFADRVVSHDIGHEGGNKQGAIGRPDLSMEEFKLSDPRICNLGLKGVLTLEFSDNALTNVNGPDLYIFEMGAIEPTKLEISKDGIEWIDIGQVEGGTAMVDLEGFVKPNETFNYIRLTDLMTFSELPGADVDAVGAIGGALRMNLDSAVLFDTGKYELKESATSELEKLVASIHEIPKGTIIVEGHTDNVGNPQSNQTLSLNRAKEVLTYLEANLKGQYQFQKKGLGESNPIATNDTKEGRQTNRRVEILVIPTN